MKIGIIVAMDKEFAQLTTIATDMKEEVHGGRKFVTGRIAHNKVVMQQCGIGKLAFSLGQSLCGAERVVIAGDEIRITGFAASRSAHR